MRLKVVCTAAALLAAVPGSALALGLGDIDLKSTLNAPLNAEIELFATPEELASLRAQLASRDTFTRYGLDYPSFLTGIQVRAVSLADGRTVIRLTSSAAMTEPFATILVEASWARGRIQREYTLLFDPPAFAPAQAAPAPIAAPTTGTGDRSGAVTRPAAPAASRPAPVAAAAAPAGGGGDYQVRSGDSLSGIARSQYGRSQTDRGMIAIYRANPEAFGGNINRLRAGAVLRLPEESAVAAIDPSEATAEVRRQAAAWSGGVPASSSPSDASGGDAARLRLVPPGSTPAPGAGTGTGGGDAQVNNRVAQLEAELAESRRLLELRNAELARLQGVGAAAPATPAPGVAAPGEEIAVEDVTGAAPAAAEPAAEAPATPAVEETKPAEAAAPAAPAAPSLLDRLKSLWYVPAGLLVLLLGALGLVAARRRREQEDSFAFTPPVEPTYGPRDTSADTLPLRKTGGESGDPGIVVEETPDAGAGSTRKTRTIDLDEGTDTATSMSVPALDASGTFDQGDPLAEADFHMAYGLYDQAADLVKLALEREPGRRDLKLKLLEVFFVWGNKDQFLQTARDLAATRDAAQPGEWEKVVIMGKQIAPEDSLFSQSYAASSPASVDLNLEGGQNLVDFDLPSDSSVSLTPPEGATQAVAALDEGMAGLDFVLDDSALGDDGQDTTRRQAVPDLVGKTAIDFDAPTVEQPQPDFGDALAQKIDAHAAQMGVSPDQTAELAIDDLGLDLGKLEATGNSNLLDDSRLVRALEATPDEEATLVAGLDETSRQLLGEAVDGNQPTELLPLSDLDLEGATAHVPSLDLDLGLDSNAETGKSKAPEFAGLDLDVGAAELPLDSGYQATQRIDPGVFDGAPQEEATRELEPVTMSEVGTKLDLARAYMDMGDPDGARSILNEVLQEGSDAQRQEAQRLIDSIPG